MRKFFTLSPLVIFIALTLFFSVTGCKEKKINEPQIKEQKADHEIANNNTGPEDQFDPRKETSTITDTQIESAPVAAQKKQGYTEEEYEEKFEEENDMYDGPDKAIEFEIERTRDLATGKVPWTKLLLAMDQTQQARQLTFNSPNLIQALSWTERGPNSDVSGPSGNSRPNNDVTAGRIRGVMIDSLDATHRTVWAGGVDGGLWKTTNITANPANWILVNDFLSNLAVSAICQDPRPGFQNNMYFCTGESFRNADAVRGVGVFKSTDAGVSWSFLSSTSSFTSCTRIVCDFQGNVYLATRNSGLLRSVNGGTSWATITPAGAGNNICDLEISSAAVAGRLHMATGIGSAQTYRYTDIPSTVTSASGWNAPTTSFPSFNERAELACSGDVLYALPVNNATNNVPVIYKSTDGGDNWAATVAQPGGGTWANGQGWYSLSAGINPANSNELIIGGLDCYKTADGGTSWTKISTWVGFSGQYVHADQHNVQWWDGGTKLLFACDGGIHYSADGGTTIRDRNVGLRIKQFYSIAIHPTLTNYFLAGAQDNGVHQLTNAGLGASTEVYGGDGCFVAIDQNEPQFQFGSYVYNVYRRSTNGGASWNTPISDQGSGRFVNPWDYDNNTNIIYACHSAGQFLRWDNPQTGSTTAVVPVTAFGTGNVSAVHTSPYTAHRVYFGTGVGGIIQVDNANAATPTGTVINTGAGMPAGFVNCIVTGSSDQNLMACFTNYGVNNIWVSSNGGTNWTAIDGNLPDMPVRWALFHPDTDTKAFIATETGVWETDLINGASTIWTPGLDFPTVRTDMIKYRSSDRTIAAGTHGRGVWTSTVSSPASGFQFNSPAPATAACPAPASMAITLGTVSIGAFSNPITLSATAGVPGGTNVTFTPNPVTPGNNSVVTLNNTNTLIAGSYVITISGAATGAVTQTRNLTYTITAGTGPAITAPPPNQTVCTGATTSFSITAATATAFQWQLSTDGGTNYTPISNGGIYSNATTNTLTLTGVTAGLTNNRYRCIASTLCGTTTSAAGILTVNTAPAITTQPQSITLCAGSNTTFNAAATGTTLTYQWQISTTAVPAFTNIAGATSASYTVSGITAGMNGDQYRCVVSGACTPPAVSNAAILTVITSVAITIQPSNATACDGANSSFTVAGSGTGIIYQWQVNTGSGFINVPAAAPYSGGTTATLTITGAVPAMNGYQYRCQLSNATCTTPGVSNAASLTVNTLPAISANPQNATICTGGGNTFSITASGTGITYQWQVSTTAVPAFTNIAGATTSSYTVTGATAGMNANQYRCIVSGTCIPAVTSATAILTVIIPVAVSTQPADAELCSGSNATFTVAGTSTQAIIYQWEVSSNGGTTWSAIAGATSASYTLNAVTTAVSSNRYRCQLSNATCTVPTISNAAVLTVRQLPSVTLTAAPLTSLLPGKSTTLTAVPSASTGGTLTTTWTYNTNPLTVTGNSYTANVEKTGSYQVRIQELWSSGLTCAALSPVVVIDAPASSRLFIFPSPNDGRFTVSYYNGGGSSTSRTVTVYDSRGSKVDYKKFTVTGPYTLLSIDVRPALKGVYYVVVGDANNKKLAEGKVMVQ